MSRLFEQIAHIQRPQPVQDEPPLKTGVVTGFAGSRYLVFDGDHEIEVESGLNEQLQVNDTVWLCRGRSNMLIIAATGTNQGNT